MSRTLRTALVAVALTGAAGCGGGGPSATPSRGAVSPSDSTPTSTPSAAAAVVTAAAEVACSAAASSIALPAGWPAALPLPPGFVLNRTEVRDGNRLIAYGRVPGDFHAVVTFFNRELPKSGHPQTEGQLDPDDAESDFGGTSFSGRWKVGRAGDCPGQSALVVVVLPTVGATASP